MSGSKINAEGDNLKNTPTSSKPKSPRGSLKQQGFCDKNNTKRLINVGTEIEQRPWNPTKRLGAIGAETSSPGPAFLSLPSLIGGKVHESKKPTGPAFSLAGRFKKSYHTYGPGPAQYDLAGLAAKGKNTPPAASLKGVQRERMLVPTPGPGDYYAERASKAVINAMPMYSFGKKPKPPKRILTPAPNVYKIPTVVGGSKEGPIRSAPAYSMAGRLKYGSSQDTKPGPGQYDGDYKVSLKAPPAYTMRPKVRPPTDGRKPGPAAHCPEKYMPFKSAPAPSFAIRHTPFLGQRKLYLIPDRIRECTDMVRQL